MKKRKFEIFDMMNFYDKIDDIGSCILFIWSHANLGI